MSSPLFVAGILVGLFGQFATTNVVARVDGDEIVLADLQERAAQTSAAGGTPRADLLTDDLVNESLIAHEARTRGLAKRPEVLAAAEAERRRAAAKLLELELARNISVDEQKLAELFHKGSDVVTLEEVVLSTEADARATLDRLEKGAKLADEAKSSFDTNAAKNGGKVGSRSRGQLEDALATIAFSAPLNKFVGPVKLELGWAVVRVTERQLGAPADLAKRHDDIKKFAESQTRTQYRTHYVLQLRKQAKVVLDEAFIKATGTRLDLKSEEASHVVATVGAARVIYAEVVAEVRRLFGGAEGGHASGPAVKTEMAWSLVDRALLENEAIAHGLGDSKEVRVRVAAAERDALVRCLSGDVRASAAGHGDDAVRKLIADLRTHAQIQVDRDVIARATGAHK